MKHSGELHLVKHLYVDDDGNILAETWSGVIAFAVPKCSVGQPHGVAGLNGAGHIDLPQLPPFIEEYEKLPPKGPDWAGKPVRIRTTGTKTEVYVCVMNSYSNYEWVKLSEST